MLLFHYRNESGSVKRDRGEAAYSRAAFISDSSENASKHAAMGEKVSGFQSGGSSVPHTCPQVPAAGSLPHATARLLHSEAQVAEVSRQRVPPGSLLTLGAPRDAGRTDRHTHRHTHARAANSECALAAKHVTWHTALPGGSAGGHNHLRAGGGPSRAKAARHRGHPTPQPGYFSQPEFAAAAAAAAAAAFQRPADPRPAPRTKRPARRCSAGAVPQPQQLLPRAAPTAPPGRDPPRASRRTCWQPSAGWERCSGQLCGAGAAGEPGRSGRRRALPRAERALGAEGRAASGGRSEDGGSAAARPSRP